MKSMLKPCLAVAIAASLFACSASRTNKRDSFDSAALMKSTTVSDSEKSLQFTEFAEELLTPVNFMHADALLDKAIATDSSNKKAQLLKHAIGSQMLMRGFYARIKPYIANKPRAQAQYKTSVDMLPEGDLKKFLFDGKEDISTELDLQKLLAEVAKSNDDFRLFVKANKEVPFTITANSWLHNGRSSSEFNRNKKAGIDRCAAVVIGEVYKIKECPFVESQEISMNKADMETLQQAIAGMEIVNLVSVAYNMSEAGTVIEKYSKYGSSTQKIWADLTKTSAFGRLRSAKSLKAIPKMGLDAVAGLRWAQTVYKETCPTGTMVENSRPHMMLEDGLCIPNNNEFDDTLGKIESALNGNSIVFHIAANKKVAQNTDITTKPLALFETPVANLQDIQPEFNKCGQIAKINGAPLSNAFLSHDANQALDLISTDDCK